MTIDYLFVQCYNNNNEPVDQWPLIQDIEFISVDDAVLWKPFNVSEPIILDQPFEPGPDDFLDLQRLPSVGGFVAVPKNNVKDERFLKTLNLLCLLINW
jgi:hypothetical protein